MNCFLFCKSIKFLMEFQSTDSKTEKATINGSMSNRTDESNIEIKQP